MVSESESSDVEQEEVMGKNVIHANSLADPLTRVEEYRSFACKDGSTAVIKYYSVADLSDKLLAWTLDLLQRNMRSLYHQSSWGWKPAEKKEEMTEAEAKYLIAFINDNPVAFSHFRFDMDYGHEVTYCYEIQIESHARSLGLGKHIMTILEALTTRLNLSKVVLTAFKHNPKALGFFKAIGFQEDETSPGDDDEECYVILSKGCDGKCNELSSAVVS